MVRIEKWLPRVGGWGNRNSLLRFEDVMDNMITIVNNIVWLN